MISEVLKTCSSCGSRKWYKRGETHLCDCGKHPDFEESKGAAPGVIDNFPVKGQYVRLGPNGMYVRSKEHWKEEMKRIGDQQNTVLREYDG